IVSVFLGELPECFVLEQGLTAYPWHVDTKYYEVNVNLCALETKSLGSQEYANSVQAVVIYFDSENPCGLEEVNKWIPYVKEYEVDIQILLCVQCKEVNENVAQEWCLKEGYELIELEPKLDEEWESEQDFIETTGIKRVKQALEAHVWPNLTLKDRKEPTSMSALLHGGVCRSTAIDHGLMFLYLDDLLSDEHSDLGFSELFNQLMSMKERASSLPHDKRKEFAELVVRAYWQAIDGDEKELFE
ncbi:hypothetical protein AAG570_007834, partial [Ranatra chinensis]